VELLANRVELLATGFNLSQRTHGQRRADMQAQAISWAASLSMCDYQGKEKFAVFFPDASQDQQMQLEDGRRVSGRQFMPACGRPESNKWVCGGFCGTACGLWGVIPSRNGGH